MSLKARSLPSFFMSPTRGARGQNSLAETDLFGAVFPKPYFFVK
jgi:hypothetical protein